MSDNDIIKQITEISEKDSDVELRLFDRKHGRLLYKDLTTREAILITAIISGSGEKWHDLPLKGGDKINE